jgi:hypothetical protein
MNRVLKKQILLCVQDAKKEKEPSFRYRINRGGEERGIFSGKTTMPGLFPPKGKAFRKLMELAFINQRICSTKN